MANKYASWSPYNFVMSNPIRLIDSDGKGPSPIDYLAAAITNVIKNKVNSALNSVKNSLNSAKDNIINFLNPGDGKK